MEKIKPLQLNPTLALPTTPLTNRTSSLKPHPATCLGTGFDSDHCLRSNFWPSYAAAPLHPTSHACIMLSEQNAHLLWCMSQGRFCQSPSITATLDRSDGQCGNVGFKCPLAGIWRCRAQQPECEPWNCHDHHWGGRQALHRRLQGL